MHSLRTSTTGDSNIPYLGQYQWQTFDLRIEKCANLHVKYFFTPILLLFKTLNGSEVDLICTLVLCIHTCVIYIGLLAIARPATTLERNPSLVY
jgi:hypothetical protein